MVHKVCRQKFARTHSNGCPWVLGPNAQIDSQIKLQLYNLPWSNQTSRPHLFWVCNWIEKIYVGAALRSVLLAEQYRATTILLVSASQIPKHAHLQFWTAGTKHVLSFVDYRRFGSWRSNQDWSPDRGPDAVTDYQVGTCSKRLAQLNIKRTG